MTEYATPRHAQLALLQKTFTNFLPFLIVGMKFLGFSTTAIQKDIGLYLEYGPKDLMVQAQRSQAKSTITALFAVWTLIQDPRARVLIISAGGTQANEISTLIVRLILNMDMLECLRPDQQHGDRVSVEKFDVHYSLKGVDKSPSVACIGIGGNLQGKRADLLIADDVESHKNSRTATNRELLLQQLRDFSSIAVDRVGEHGNVEKVGRVIFLGTPQSDSSVYNTLPSSGFGLRIWPGRYPTLEEEAGYGEHLAPYIRQRMTADPSLRSGAGPTGKSGHPTDPELLGEATLLSKENKQGPAYFQLQHMLCTLLSDLERYPLKAANIVVMRLGEKLPVHLVRGMTAEYLRPYQVGSLKFQCSIPSFVGVELMKPAGRVLAIDPAGGGKNGDETGLAVCDQLAGNVFVRNVSAVAGGFDEKTLAQMVAYCKRWNPDVILVEKNMGHGAFTQVILPLLRAAGVTCAVQETYSTGQKEQRIADTLEPIAARGALIFDEEVILSDWESTLGLPSDKRQLFTLMHQFIKLTRDRGALVKDDRLDALSIAVGHFIGAIAQDSAKVAQLQRDQELVKFMQDPLSHNRYTDAAQRGVRQFANPNHRKMKR